MEQLETPPGPERGNGGSHSGNRPPEETSGLPPEIDLAALQVSRSALQAAKVPTLELATDGSR